jgi:hypothetical protein
MELLDANEAFNCYLFILTISQILIAFVIFFIFPKNFLCLFDYDKAKNKVVSLFLK